MAVEIGWQRRFDFLRLTPEEIERLIVPFARGVRVAEATPLAGGLRNTNYRLRLSSLVDPVVLRVFSATDELGHNAAAREAAVLDLIAPRVAAPRLLHSQPAADLPWNLVTWVDGERFDLFIQHATPEQVRSASRAAGRALAAIHAFAFPQPGWFQPDLSLGPPPWPDISWSEMLLGWVRDGAAGAHLPNALRDRLVGLIGANAGAVLSLGAAARLVHADFKPWNLLVRDTQVAAVLDWEGAYAGNPMTDIGIYLRYSDRLDPAYREGFEAGYRRGGGDLPADWFRRARLMDLVNLVYFLEFRGSDPAVVRDIVPLIETTVAAFAP